LPSLGTVLAGGHCGSEGLWPGLGSVALHGHSLAPSFDVRPPEASCDPCRSRIFSSSSASDNANRCWVQSARSVLRPETGNTLLRGGSVRLLERACAHAWLWVHEFQRGAGWVVALSNVRGNTVYSSCMVAVEITRAAVDRGRYVMGFCVVGICEKPSRDLAERHRGLFLHTGWCGRVELHAWNASAVWWVMEG